MPTSTPTGMSPLEWALYYHARGWQTVPGEIGEKKPSGRWKSRQDELVSESWIRAQWGPDFGTRNVFIITGRVSHLAVLDLDNEEAIALWQDKLGKDFDTCTVQTSRGLHLYYGLDEEWRGWAGKHGEAHWEFRAEGNGVMAPPSQHSSGKHYAWIDQSDLVTRLRPVPSVLRKENNEHWRAKSESELGALTEAARSVSSASGTSTKTKIKEPGRNNALASFAGKIAREIPNQEDGWAKVVEWNLESCDPPNDEDELKNLRPQYNRWWTKHWGTGSDAADRITKALGLHSPATTAEVSGVSRLVRLWLEDGTELVFPHAIIGSAQKIQDELGLQTAGQSGRLASRKPADLGLVSLDISALANVRLKNREEGDAREAVDTFLDNCFEVDCDWSDSTEAYGALMQYTKNRYEGRDDQTPMKLLHYDGRRVAFSLAEMYVWMVKRHGWRGTRNDLRGMLEFIHCEIWTMRAWPSTTREGRKGTAPKRREMVCILV